MRRIRSRSEWVSDNWQSGKSAIKKKKLLFFFCFLLWVIATKWTSFQLERDCVLCCSQSLDSSLLFFFFGVGRSVGVIVVAVTVSFGFIHRARLLSPDNKTKWKKSASPFAGWLVGWVGDKSARVLQIPCKIEQTLLLFLSLPFTLFVSLAKTSRVFVSARWPCVSPCASNFALSVCAACSAAAVAAAVCITAFSSECMHLL